MEIITKRYDTRCNKIFGKFYIDIFKFNGAIYVHGRDHFFRPIIIVNATKLIGDIDLTL